MSSYKQIFKSSFLIGGSQVINIIIGILKNKVLAILLGPAGIGVMGVYMAISAVILPIAGLGLGSSGVRQISEAFNENNKVKISFLIKNIRKYLLAAGLISVALVILFSEVLAKLSFGAAYQFEHVIGICFISALVLFDSLTSGERAILQGARKLKSLASGQIIGAVAGAVVSIFVVLVLGSRGISLFLVLSSLCIFITFRYFSNRDVPVIQGDTSAIDHQKERKLLLTLGLAFIITTIAGSIVAYVIRMIIVDKEGLEGVGIYQAAWGLINMGFNVVLLAMGTDFYPRLVSVAADTREVNRTVNEQVEITLLFALPIVLVLYLFSPFILEIFFSLEFTSGSDLTKWLAISCFFRVLCWPLSYITIAKGRKRIFVITSVFWEIVHVPIVFLCLAQWGMEGVGISYVFDYLIVVVGATLVAYKFFEFEWSEGAIISIGVSFLFIVMMIFIYHLALPPTYLFSLGIILILASILRLFLVAKRKLNFNVVRYIQKKIK